MSGIGVLVEFFRQAGVKLNVELITGRAGSDSVTGNLIKFGCSLCLCLCLSVSLSLSLSVCL